MTYDALRRGRISQRGQWYSVTTVAYHRTPWFFDPACARAAILELRSTAHLGGVGTFAWVLMPDHLHWLLSLEGDAKLADVMRRFKSRSARAVNGVLGRTGPIWQRAYYDHALRRDEDLRLVARYLIGNPLRAGLATEVGRYPYWDAIWVTRQGAEV